ncbi:MAG: HAD family hydrolase [Acidilobaceae archaeon]
MERAVVFDMDGVLVDSSERFRICEQESLGRKEFWRCFLSEKYIHLDKPRREVAQLFQQYRERGYKVFVVSGRPKRMMTVTLSQLLELGLRPDRVILKEGGYEVEHKVRVMRELAKRYEIEVVYDDNPKVAEALGNLGIKVLSP